jgi:hypothetical protein
LEAGNEGFRWGVERTGSRNGNVLLVGFAQVLVGLLGLVLEQLQLPLQGIKLRAVGSSAVSGALGILEGLLEFVDFLLEEGIAVAEGGDFLLFSKVLLLERLDAGPELFVLGLGLLGLHAQGVHFLCGNCQSCC